jgi:hypothetical protein
MSGRKFSKDVEERLDSDLNSRKRDGANKTKQDKEKSSKSEPEKSKKTERTQQKDDRIMVTVDIPRKALAQLWKAAGLTSQGGLKAEARLFASK